MFDIPLNLFLVNFSIFQCSDSHGCVPVSPQNFRGISMMLERLNQRMVARDLSEIWESRLNLPIAISWRALMKLLS